MRGACQNTICEQPREPGLAKNIKRKRKKQTTLSEGEVGRKRIIAGFRDKCRFLTIEESRKYTQNYQAILWAK